MQTFAVREPILQSWSVVVVLISDSLLLCTLLAIVYQIQQQKIAERNTLVFHKHRLNVDTTASLQNFFLEMFKQPQLAQIWERGRTDLSTLQSADEMVQFKWACVYWFEHIACAYRMVTLDVIKEHDLEGWAITIKEDFLLERKPGLVHYWNVLSEDFDPRFKAWVVRQVGEGALCDCESCLGRREP